MSNYKTQMTEKELEQVSGGPHIRNFNGARLFVTYTEHKNPFKVEIHKPVFRNDPIGVAPCPE